MNKLTREQAAIIGAYTGILCGGISEYHAYIEKLMCRRVQTIELMDEELMDRVKLLAKDDFMLMCAER